LGIFLHIIFLLLHFHFKKLFLAENIKISGEIIVRLVEHFNISGEIIVRLVENVNISGEIIVKLVESVNISGEITDQRNFLTEMT
jgi:plasmid maintenance system antidote protein VapI